MINLQKEISCIEKLTNDIIRIFPDFFDNFKNWEYETGRDAGKDFKNIFIQAKKINKLIITNKNKQNETKL
jgi:hypothetical protein